MISGGNSLTEYLCGRTHLGIICRDLAKNKTSEYLGVLRQGLSDMVFYPGATEDRFFKSTYQHKHHTSLECVTCANDDGGDGVCNAAVGLSCEQIKCDEQELVHTSRSTVSAI